MRFRTIALVTLLLTLVLAPVVAEPVLPIFDAHVHYNEEALVSFKPKVVMALMDQAGVRAALVSSTPDDGTLRLHQESSRRIVPILRPYRSQGDMYDWFRSEEILVYVEKRLQRHIYQGIGEFHLMDEAQARTPQMRRLIGLATERDIVLHVHSGAGPVHALFAADPRLKILWAHAGVFASPEEIRGLLDRYPKLWTELSLRAPDIAPNGRLDAAWRELFLRHSDRFLIGTDTWATSRWHEYQQLVQEHRRWLAQLPEHVAQHIAYRNAERIFARGR